MNSLEIQNCESIELQKIGSIFFQSRKSKKRFKIFQWEASFLERNNLNSEPEEKIKCDLKNEVFMKFFLRQEALSLQEISFLEFFQSRIRA